MLKAPSFATLQAANKGQVISLEALDQSTTSLEMAATWDGSGTLRNELGYLYLLRASHPNTHTSERQNYYRDAALALREALLRRPAQPHGWVRLAYAIEGLKGPSSQGATYLAHSLQTGPYVPELTIPRLELLFRHWPFLSAHLRVLTGQQIRFAWLHHEKALLQLAESSAQGTLIRQALRPLTGAQARFDQALAHGL